MRWPSWPSCTRRPRPGVRSCSARRARRAEIARARTLDFLPETAAVRNDPDWRVAPAGPRPGRPPRGDHRPDRPQDDHQRPQLGRQGLARRLRGRLRAHLGNVIERPAQPDRRLRAPDRLHRPPRARVRAEARRGARHRRGPPARLAPGGAAPEHRRRPGPRRARRLRPVLLPQRPAACSPRARARTSTCPRRSPTSRPASGTTSSSSRRTCSASRRARSAPPS